MKQIQLSQGKFAIVDDEDYDYLMQWKWSYDIYAHRVTSKGKIRMHRLLNATPEGLFTDHINGDKLDNRKSNLRSCSAAENRRNYPVRKDSKSGYRGVYWAGNMGKWRAVISFEKKRQTIGFFENILDAAQAYNAKALELHGTFARLNKIGVA